MPVLPKHRESSVLPKHHVSSAKHVDHDAKFELAELAAHTCTAQASCVLPKHRESSAEHVDHDAKLELAEPAAHTSPARRSPAGSTCFQRSRRRTDILSGAGSYENRHHGMRPPKKATGVVRWRGSRIPACPSAGVSPPKL